jgi:hypothetical protein
MAAALRHRRSAVPRNAAQRAPATACSRAAPVGAPCGPLAGDAAASPATISVRVTQIARINEREVCTARPYDSSGSSENERSAIPGLPHRGVRDTG